MIQMGSAIFIFYLVACDIAHNHYVCCQNLIFLDVASQQRRRHRTTRVRLSLYVCVCVYVLVVYTPPPPSRVCVCVCVCVRPPVQLHQCFPCTH